MKKETTFHWYKEEDEIVLETPPDVMSGACALPIPLVTTVASAGPQGPRHGPVDSRLGVTGQMFITQMLFIKYAGEGQRSGFEC